MSKEQASGRTARRSVKPKSELLYTRGEYRLYSVPGRSHEIRVYNPVSKQNDRTLTGTTNLEDAKRKLDKLYLGDGLCPHCGQGVSKDEDGDSDSIVRLIDDYLAAHGEDQISSPSIGARLVHVKRYIGDKPVRVGNVTEAWITAFRKWMLTEPFYVGNGATRRAKFRKASTVEGSVLQLSAAIRYFKKTPLFTAKQVRKLSEPVDLRADIPLLASLFRYCLYPESKSEIEAARIRRSRLNLLYYLRLSVATWGRPEAVLEADLTPSAKQWVSAGRVFRLNPAHRQQNTKYRATVPVPEIVGQWLDSLPKQPILPSVLSKATWRRMMLKLQPDAAEGEAGMKLIRRSMATLGRKRLGEANWIQGKMMMGHVQPDVSDVYAVADPANLGLALKVTNEIIAEIEALCPGAFNNAQRIYSASSTNVVTLAA